MLKCLIFTIFLIVGLNSYAGKPQSESSKDATQTENVVLKSDEAITTPREQKNRYYGISLGYASPNYGPDSESTLRLLQSLAGYSRTPLAFSFDIYWKKNDSKFMQGISLLGVYDFIKVSVFELQTHQVALNYSVIRYDSGIPGDGFFIRADAGEGFAYAQLNKPNNGSKISSTPYNWAILTQLGAGYSIPTSDTVSLSAGLYGSVFWIPGGSATNTSIQASCLF